MPTRATLTTGNYSCAMASDPRDYKLDISSMSGESAAPGENSKTSRPFLSVHFACCGVYQRIYRDNSGTTYSGHCPRCAKPVTFKVGPGGTSSRFFDVR